MPVISGSDARLLGFEGGTWKLDVSRNGADWTCKSPKFGRVEYAVVSDKSGKPLFDRPRYFEAPHVITVVWGTTKDGDERIGLVLEARPHAGVDADGNDLKFWGVPRGFRNNGEDPLTAAKREAGEESSANVVLDAYDAGELNPNPTFVGSFGPVVFLRVDLDRLDAIRPDRNEKIYKVKFFAIHEIIKMIVAGEHEGGQLSDGVSLATLMKFIAYKGWARIPARW